MRYLHAVQRMHMGFVFMSEERSVWHVTKLHHHPLLSYLQDKVRVPPQPISLVIS